MASKPVVDRYRKHLKIAAEVVLKSQRADKAAIAASLDELSGPDGFERLSVDAPKAASDAVNFSMLIPKHMRKMLQDAAVDSAEAPDAKPSIVLGSTLDVLLQRLLDGELEPAELPKDASVGVERVNLNVPVSAARVQAVRDALPELKARLRYAGNPTAPKLSFRLLLDAYGLDYEPTPHSREFGGLSKMHLFVAPRLAEAIEEKLLLVGEDMRRLIRQGYAKVLDGSWEPFDVPRAPFGSDPDRTRLTTGTDPAQTDELRALLPELSARLGYRVTPQTTAIAYLVEELGLEELFTAEYGVPTD